METAENKFAIIHETLGKANNTLSVKMLCEIAGVSRSGYYNWVKAADKRNEGNIYEIAAYGTTCNHERQENKTINEKVWTYMQYTKSKSLQTDSKSNKDK